MRTGLLRALAAGLFVATSALPPVAPASAADYEGLTIRLLDAPVEHRDDPRALAYIVDHLQPGDALSRRVEVRNTTAAPMEVDLYVGPASITRAAWTPGPAGSTSELTRWSATETGRVRLAPGERRPVEVSIHVPDDASDGERYGVVWAQTTGSDGQVRAVNRVGVRIYLSVAGGTEPATDFGIDSLAGHRDEQNRPVVTAEVTNTGGRALDLAGSLTLRDGPGGLSAGPFDAGLATTLAPGDVGTVLIPLDPRIPDGPWRVHLTLSSGEVAREVEAPIDFADPRSVPTSDSGAPRAWWSDPVTGTLAVALGTAFVIVLVAAWRRRGGDDEPDGEPLIGPRDPPTWPGCRPRLPR